MADQVTVTTSLDLTQAAWEMTAYYNLRPQLFFDGVATVQPTNQDKPGSSVTFVIINDIPVAVTPLDEVIDVDTIAYSDSTITLTLAEYGNAVMTSARLRGTSFLPINPQVANVIGFNAGASIDTLARNALAAGTNVVYPINSGVTQKTARNALVGGTSVPDKLSADTIRQQLAKLRAANVRPISGSGYYIFYLHPDVSYDLRSATGAANWRDPHTYSAPENIWNGEVGVFESFRFIETPRAPVLAGAGAGTTPNAANVYQNFAVGDEALAKTWSSTDGNGPLPRVFPGPVTDHLRRKAPVGWYWLGGYGVFRQQAVRRIETTSTIGGTA